MQRNGQLLSKNQYYHLMELIQKQKKNKEKIKEKEKDGKIVEQVLQSITGDKRINIEEIRKAKNYLAKLFEEKTIEEK